MILRALVARRRGRDPLASVRPASTRSTRRSRRDREHRRRPTWSSATTSLDADDATFEDGTAMDDQELRDQLMTLLLAATNDGDGARLDLRPAAPPPGRARHLRASLENGEDAYLKATIAESLRLRPVVPLAGRRLAADLVTDDLELPPARCHCGDLAHPHRPEALPRPVRLPPERFLEAAPETYAWIPSAAASDAASAPPSPSSRCGSPSARSCSAASSQGRPAPERTGRRNITFSPRAGTPVVVDSAAPRASRGCLAR